MSNEIEQKIINIVATSLKKEASEINLNTTLEDLGTDSLDQVELLMAVEAAFDISIVDEEASKIKKISDIVDYVKKYHTPKTN